MCKYGLPTSRLSEVIVWHTYRRQTDTVHSLRRGTDISVQTELFPLVTLTALSTSNNKISLIILEAGMWRKKQQKQVCKGILTILKHNIIHIYTLYLTVSTQEEIIRQHFLIRKHSITQLVNKSSVTTAKPICRAVELGFKKPRFFRFF